MNNNILIFGATGQLGNKLLRFCKLNNLAINTITCFNNTKKLTLIKKKYNIPFSFVTADKSSVKKLINHITKNRFKFIYFLDCGSESLNYLNAIIKTQNKSYVSIANKEMIIAGGPLLKKQITKTNNFFIPLDSEHFSLINSNCNNKEVEKIYITASGGPFYFNKKTNLNAVTFKQVLSHPKWIMGKNNLIDSSNFINKLLEIYELSSIYDIEVSKIDFVISQSAFIHSLIKYNDGIVSLNCFNNDMLIPLIKPLNLHYGLRYKAKNKIISKPSDFLFELPNDNRFLIFKYFLKLKMLPHSEQINLMIVNNIAQKLYLNNKIKYNDIIKFIIKNINFNSSKKLNSFNDIIKYIYKLRTKYIYYET